MIRGREKPATRFQVRRLQYDPTHGDNNFFNEPGKKGPRITFPHLKKMPLSGY